MSANSYLERLATKGITRELEKVNINKSLSLLNNRIDTHFRRTTPRASGVKEHFVFGSYTRGTMLPRSMDSQSDVDYMVVFDNPNLRPQSCLDRLRRFAEKHYSTAEIFQSHPTVILSLNHIRFELVPAIKTFFGGIEIPTKSSILSEWTPTSPNEFNNSLTEKNKGHGNLIKPLIRLLKYWNARNKYPFDSFKFENMVVSHWTFSSLVINRNLWQRFRDFINQLNGDTRQQSYAIERTKRIVAEIGELESCGNAELAEIKLKSILPEIK